MYRTEPVLYALDMAEISVSDARAALPEVIARARTEAVFVTRHGKAQAVLVSPERYEQLVEALEEHDDMIAFDAALAEEGDDIPWEQAKADLGWI